MNHTECDSFAQFVLTPDPPPAPHFFKYHAFRFSVVWFDLAVYCPRMPLVHILATFIWIFMFKFISELVVQQTTCNSCGKVNLTMECEISRAIGSNM